MGLVFLLSSSERNYLYKEKMQIWGKFPFIPIHAIYIICTSSMHGDLSKMELIPMEFCTKYSMHKYERNGII